MSSITSPQPTQENAANPAALPHAALVKIWGVSLFLLALFIPGLARADFDITSATVNSGSSVTVAPSESIDVAVTLNYSGNTSGANGEWESTKWTVNGVDTCSNHSDREEPGPDSVSFSITAPTTPGTHTLTLKPYSNDNCGGQTGSNFDLNNAITVQQPTPVADYRFDECSWTSGTSGAVSDSAGSYHGTPYSTNTVSGGVVNHAADLSASGTSDYIRWPISLLNGRTNFTISLWFKTSANKSQQEIFHGLGSGSGDDEIEIYLVNSTGIRVNIRDEGNNYNAASSFANGAWHHLAVTRSGTSVCVYLDATLLDCNTRSSNALSITNSNALLTGQEQDSFGGGFTSSQALEAQLDEFKVFAAALSASSISSIYANELAGNNWDGSARSNPCPIDDGTVVSGGCTESTVGADTLITCTGNGTFTPPAGVTHVRYLVVAGGGGGGGIGSDDEDGAGGGGAGGILSGTSVAVTPGTSYSIIVGGGGAAGTGSDNGGNGGDSTFSTLTAIGGGGGAREGGHNGRDGGSGGGGSDNDHGGDGTAGQGNDGGDGNNNDGGGGGGGAGEAGANGTDTTGGDGGDGVENNITGASVYYGGGGGGGADGGGAGGAAGLGGGGSAPTGRGAGNSGTANTGGGGGGATGSDSGSAYNGGEGGAGIVVLRYNASTDCATFRDEFSSDSYGRNDGTASWTGNWTEVGDNGSSSNGDIEIAGNRLQFEGDADNNTSIYREADLSGYTSATLSFDYSESGWDSHDTLEVRVSANGGADWTTIQTFNNDQGAGGTFSQDITAYIAGNFRLAFVVTSANGGDDEFYIDNVQIEACTTSSSLDHIRLEHDGDGLTCMPETITVKACADVNCTSNATSSTTVTLSGTGWSSNPITFIGSTMVDLSKTIPTTVTLGTSAVSPSPAGATRCYIGATQDCNLIFSDVGFIFAATTGGSGLTIPSQTAGTPSGPYYLRAIKTSTTTGACEAALVGANSVDLAYECNDPATCYAADLMNINGGTATTIARNNNGSVTSYTPSVPMTFDAGGNAPFTFNYGDVGRVTLHARKTVSSVLLSGATNAFIVKPYDFSVIPCAASVVGACTAAPTDPELVGGGSAFAKAGEQFKATITARTSTTPPTITPSFGSGSNNATETVNLTHNRLAPTGAGTADGALSGTIAIHRSDFSSGVATVSNLAWSEVGVISLTATNSTFLGASLSTTGASANLGRFIPDHFAITPGAVTEGCDAGNFTYFGQDGFATPFTLTAQNAANGTTQNYTGNFAKLDLTSWNNYNFTATWDTTPNPSSTLLASATAPTGSWSNGIASVAAIHQASRPASPVVPANITINAKPTDTDDVTIATATSVQTAATPLRYGRLVLKNAYGTEREALKMRLQSQYYNGSAFITNADDSCVSFSAAALACTDANAADTLICTDVTASGTNVGNGQDFTLSAPNKTGPLLYTLTVAAWLQYEWDNAGNDYNENPFARANFGIYRGNDRIINWREIIR